MFLTLQSSPSIWSRCRGARLCSRHISGGESITGPSLATITSSATAACFKRYPDTSNQRILRLRRSMILQAYCDLCSALHQDQEPPSVGPAASDIKGGHNGNYFQGILIIFRQIKSKNSLTMSTKHSVSLLPLYRRMTSSSGGTETALVNIFPKL